MAATENNEYALEIESACLFMKHDKIIPSIRATHLKNLQSDRIKYPIKRVEMKYFTKEAGQDDLSKQNLWDDQLPTRIVLGMVNSSAFNGHIKKPFQFSTLQCAEYSTESQWESCSIRGAGVGFLFWQIPYGVPFTVSRDRHFILESFNGSYN